MFGPEILHRPNKLREEFRRGMAEMETMLAGKTESSVCELRSDIASERDARQHLEESISHVEAKTFELKHA